MNLIIQGPSGFHDAHIKAAVSEPGKDEYGRRMKKKKKKRMTLLESGIWRLLYIHWDISPPRTPAHT